MWSLFPELLGPMLVAFVVGSIVAWAVLGLLLRKRPDAAEQPPANRGP